MGSQTKNVTAGRVAGQMALAWLGTLALNAAITIPLAGGDTSRRGELIGQAAGVVQEVLFICCASYLVAKLWRARGLASSGAWLVALLFFGSVFAWAIATEPNVAPNVLMFFAAWGGALLALAVGVIASARNGSGALMACPFCAETIRAEAVVCRYCHRELGREVPPPLPR